jgi:hypothetical protein
VRVDREPTCGHATGAGGCSSPSVESGGARHAFELALVVLCRRGRGHQVANAKRYDWTVAHLSDGMLLNGEIWRAFGLQPHRAESFRLSNDPQSIEKVRDIVGLYEEILDSLSRYLQRISGARH